MSDSHLLAEVRALSPEELRAYALSRAEMIVRNTRADCDSWDDPEEWQSEAAELAHAVVLLLHNSGEAG